MYLEGGSLCSEGGWTGPASESHVRENGGSRGVRGVRRAVMRLTRTNWPITPPQAGQCPPSASARGEPSHVWGNGASVLCRRLFSQM